MKKYKNWLPLLYTVIALVVGNRIFNHWSAWLGVLIMVVAVIWCGVHYSRMALKSWSDEFSDIDIKNDGPEDIIG